MISSRILRFESGEVTVRSTSVESKSRSSSSWSSCSLPVSGSTSSTRLAFLQEHALHADVGLDVHHVVIDQVALAHGAGVLVAVHDVAEVRLGVGRRRGGQADLDGVEVVQRVPPDGHLGRRVAAVALVGDDDVEGVDRDQQLLGVVVDRLPLRPTRRACRPNRLTAMRWIVQT